VLKTVWALTQPAEATDNIMVADEDGVADSAEGILDRGRSLTRPMEETKRALGTAASVVKTDEPGEAGVCWPCVFPNRLERSQVENGAVNGTRTRTISQEARNLECMAQKICLPHS